MKKDFKIKIYIFYKFIKVLLKFIKILFKINKFFIYY